MLTKNNVIDKIDKDRQTEDINEQEQVFLLFRKLSIFRLKAYYHHDQSRLSTGHGIDNNNNCVIIII